MSWVDHFCTLAWVFHSKCLFFSGSQSHTVHEVNSYKKLASKCLKDAQRGSENENMGTIQRLLTKIEDLCSEVQFQVLVPFILGFGFQVFATSV